MSASAWPLFQNLPLFCDLTIIGKRSLFFYRMFTSEKKMENLELSEIFISFVPEKLGNFHGILLGLREFFFFFFKFFF